MSRSASHSSPCLRPQPRHLTYNSNKAYTTLVSVPKAGLMNWHTIRRYYPRLSLNGTADAKTHSRGVALNSTQALTMHLYLLHRGESSAEMDAYSLSLPKSFDEHPLTWAGSPRQSLLECLPPSSKAALKDVERRCKADWKVVREALEGHKVGASSGGAGALDSRFQSR